MTYLLILILCHLAVQLARSVLSESHQDKSGQELGGLGSLSLAFEGLESFLLVLISRPVDALLLGNVSQSV